MRKLFIVGPHSIQTKVIDTIHTHKNAHLVDHKKGEHDIGTPHENLELYSEQLVQVRSILSRLPEDKHASKATFDPKMLSKVLAPVQKDVEKLASEKKQVDTELESISEQLKTLHTLSDLDLTAQDVQPTSKLAIYVGELPSDSAVKKIEKLSDKILIKGKKRKKGLLLAVFVERELAAEVENVLVRYQFKAIDISAVQGKTYPSDPKAKLSESKHKLTKESERIHTELTTIAHKHSRMLIKAEEFLAEEVEKSAAPLRFGSTKTTFFFTCFVPEKEVQVLKKELNKATDEKIYIEEMRITEDDAVPIKLNNPGVTKNFEFFTGLYSLPNYKEFDPTFLIAITFPLFFGFMLGDAVYGLIMIGLFWFLKKKYPVGTQLFNILILAGISATFFGVLFGEVLGFEPWAHHGDDHSDAGSDSWYPLLVRTQDFNELMLIAGIVGVIHINLGLLLGAYVARRNEGWWYAITHRLSWIVLQIAFVLLYLGYTTDFPVAAAWAVFGLAMFLIYKGEGFIGIFEIPSIVSHTLSYMRLMAVGVASVYIAHMVNQFAGFIYSFGVWAIPFAAIWMIIGHSLTLAIGVLSPSIHAIRLHYVEFFTKFYKGGGIPYTPFGEKKKPDLLG